MKRRIISFLMAFVLLFSTVGVTPVINVSAANPYPYGQCTWAAWHKTYELTGISLPGWGNAREWYQNAKNAGYTCVDYYSGYIPPANSIAVWWDDGYGHVAYILSADASGANVYEGNYNDYNEITHWCNWNNMTNLRHSSFGKQTLMGFIILNPASVQEPSYATLKTDKTSYAVDETVTFTCSSDGTLNTLWIYCPDGTSLNYDDIGTTYQLGFGMSGHFQALIQTWNNIGSLCSKKIDFFVGPPTYATLKTDKTSYEVDETVTFTCSSDGTLNTLWIYCPDGTSLNYDDIGTAYQLGFGMSGHFQALIQTWNGVGSLCSEKIDFFVGANAETPAQPSVIISDRDITVKWNECKNAESYDVYLIQEPWGWEDVKMSKKVASSVTSHTFKDVAPGDYRTFVIARPNNDSVQSPWTSFSVGNNAKISALSVDREKYFTNETVKLNFGGENNGTYTLGIYKNGLRVDTIVVNGKTYEYKITEPGEYKAYMTAYNENVSVDSNWVSWTAEDLTAVLSIDKESYFTNESVKFSLGGNNNGTYILEIYKDEKKTETAVVNSRTYEYKITEPGEYKAYMTAYNDNVSVDSNWVSWTAEDDWINPFIDVKKPDWFYDGVKYANQNNIFKGITENTYGPDENMSRAMLVTALWRMSGCPIEGNNIYSDVPDGEWFTDAINWASRNAIVNGTGYGKFEPDGLITREQMVTMLRRYADFIERDTSGQGSIENFSDCADVADWALSSVKWAVEQKLINGKENNMLDPRGFTTRAEVAVLIKRFYGA